MKIYGIKFDENNTAYIKESEIENIKTAVKESYCICYSLGNAVTECDAINRRKGNGETYIIYADAVRPFTHMNRNGDTYIIKHDTDPNDGTNVWSVEQHIGKGPTWMPVYDGADYDDCVRWIETR